MQSLNCSLWYSRNHLLLLVCIYYSGTTNYFQYKEVGTIDTLSWKNYSDQLYQCFCTAYY